MSIRTHSVVATFATIVACSHAPPSPSPPASPMTATAPSRATDALARPVVAVTGADWCPTCRAMRPILSQLRREYGDRVMFVDLDLTSADTTRQAGETATQDACRSRPVCGSTCTSACAVTVARTCVRCALRSRRLASSPSWSLRPRSASSRCADSAIGRADRSPSHRASPDLWRSTRPAPIMA